MIDVEKITERCKGCRYKEGAEMKNDSISRQAAIDVADAVWSVTGDKNVAKVWDQIKDLPSAQPDCSFEIQDILDYLDTVLHPIISPEHWNVYSELHDMISTLPSAQPGEDIRAMCGECDAWNQYKNYPQPGWIPCSERLPENGHYYLWCSEMGHVQSDYYWNGFEDGMKYGYNIVAWMPLPTPWEGK